MHIFISVLFLCSSIVNAESHTLPTHSTGVMRNERVIHYCNESCTNFMNDEGFGQCKKVTTDLKGLMCYVESNSTCSDMLPSLTNPGKFYSYLACKKKDCNQSCIKFMNHKGFGQCKKVSRELNGLMCYVQPNSPCSDMLPSLSNPGKFYSVLACKKKDQPESTRRLSTGKLQPLLGQPLPAQKDISCGNNRAKFCSQCGNTSAHCNGDCKWISKKCQKKNQQEYNRSTRVKQNNDVSCGNNRADTCLQCGNTAAHCNGDCIWASGKCKNKNNKSILQEKKIPILKGNRDVSCGNNRADTCSKCGKTAAYCNGDCLWKSGKCQNKYSQKNVELFNNISCDNDRSSMCSKCGNTAAHCNGDCIWVSGKCQHKIDQNVSNKKVVTTMKGNTYVNCGNNGNNGTRTCSECGNTAEHCNGDCIWISGKCQHKNYQNDSKPKVITTSIGNYDVNCGNNRAKTCSQCGYRTANCTCEDNRVRVCSECGNTAANCNGDCIWISGKCQHRNNQNDYNHINNIGVSCTKQRLNICSQCGNKAAYCRGDCIWKSGKCQNKNKENHLKTKNNSSMRMTIDIHCGNKRAKTCSQCGNTAALCKGECMLTSGKCRHKPIQVSGKTPESKYNGKSKGDKKGSDIGGRVNGRTKYEKDMGNTKSIINRKLEGEKEKKKNINIESGNMENNKKEKEEDKSEEVINKESEKNEDKAFKNDISRKSEEDETVVSVEKITAKAGEEKEKGNSEGHDNGKGDKSNNRTKEFVEKIIEENAIDKNSMDYMEVELQV